MTTRMWTGTADEAGHWLDRYAQMINEHPATLELGALYRVRSDEMIDQGARLTLLVAGWDSGSTVLAGVRSWIDETGLGHIGGLIKDRAHVEVANIRWMMAQSLTDGYEAWGFDVVFEATIRLYPETAHVLPWNGRKVAENSASRAVFARFAFEEDRVKRERVRGTFHDAHLAASADNDGLITSAVLRSTAGTRAAAASPLRDAMPMEALDVVA